MKIVSMIKGAMILSMIGVLLSCNRQKEVKSPRNEGIERKVDSVLTLMTLEEKIGQMSVLAGIGELTGPVTKGHEYLEAVKNGRVGAMLNINGVAYTHKLQEITLTETRLGIPLLFGYDVIHGYSTIFPVPLAEACSWDLELIEKSARVAATEASAAGQHWTYAPMLDIARDPRWGRIMEGAGEDPYLGSLIAVARIRGFQGDDLSAINTIAACAKHFVAYGAAEGGRDYNTTEVSENTLREIYLPPFKAAVEANVATFMTAFNDLNGTPASGNEFLNDILRNEWKFNGMVVSDWNSVTELILHGLAQNKKKASIFSVNGGVDMDMQGYAYSEELLNLVNEGKIPLEKIDESVRNILRLKFQLGLFDDPYRYCNEERERKELLSKANRKTALEVAKESVVLLKNTDHILPLSKNIKTLTIIGPLADNREDILGAWHGRGIADSAISLVEGIRKEISPKTKIIFEKGCDIESEDRSGFKKAVVAAKKADIVILAMGESAKMSGEAACRSFIGLPGIQTELIREIHKTGKPIVLVLMNGRPLAIPWEAENLDAILETWFLGTEAGNAIADILFGDSNPSGKLVASFPYTTGQIPVYYNHKNTGRPGEEQKWFTSKYLDAPLEPLFPFGFGLSYTEFSYSDLKISQDTISMNDTLEVSIKITNTGQVAGKEVVQLYIRDWYASVTRPIKELKGYNKIYLNPGESKTVGFNISRDMLSFHNQNMNYVAEPGTFSLMVGTNSSNIMEKMFELKW
jgi:beta-glucosidase